MASSTFGNHSTVASESKSAGMALTVPFPRLTIATLERRAEPVHYRQMELDHLHAELVQAKDEVKAMIQSDLGHSKLEADLEFTLVLSELRIHRDALNWKANLVTNRAIGMGSNNIDRRIGGGIVYVVPGAHTPMYSILSPVCAGVAAGNCVIVELPQTLSRLSDTLRRVLRISLDSDTFAISDSRPTDDFLKQCVLVLQSEPQDYTPTGQVCLSPSSLRSIAIVDRTAHIAKAAQTLAYAQFSRTGSSPYAPDVVLVNEFVIDEFVECLRKHLKPSKAKEVEASRKTSWESQRRPVAGAQRLFDHVKRSEDMKLVAQGSNGSLFKVENRDCDVLRNKTSGPSMVIHAISSLDDGIDLANVKTGEALAAAFIFAALPEANYIANFVDAHISCVNHVPVELLVGPLAPLYHVPSLHPRYTVSMFQEPKPQLLHETRVTKLVETAQGSDFNTELTELMRSLETPPPPLDRKKGKPGDFFLRALVTGMVLIALPVMAGLGIAVKYSAPYVKRRIFA